APPCAGLLHIRRVPTPAGVIGQNGGLAGQCKGSRSPTTVFLAATTHANSTNANIRLSKETWVLSARVMVGAIIRPSRVGAVALVESVLQKKHPRNARAKRIVWDGT
ncbi:MAG: hypothetical protein ACLTE5_08845, partial [Bifidobacterium longum]